MSKTVFFVCIFCLMAMVAACSCGGGGELDGGGYGQHCTDGTKSGDETDVDCCIGSCNDGVCIRVQDQPRQTPDPAG